MSNTATTTDQDLIECLSEAGFTPTDAENDHPAIDATISYFEARWDAVRIYANQLWFVSFHGDDFRVMVTTPSGSILSEARFSLDPIGTRMFLASVNAA